MKKKITFIIIMILLFAVAAAEESILDAILPDQDDWGMSVDKLKDLNQANYSQCTINGEECWYVTDVEVDMFLMDAYYVFSEEGLSKIVYILNAQNDRSDKTLNKCLMALVEEMNKKEGEFDSKKTNDYKWNRKKYRVEIGKGKIKKYTGTDDTTVAIVFKKPSIKSSNQEKSQKPYTLSGGSKMPHILLTRKEYQAACRNCTAEERAQIDEKAKEYMRETYDEVFAVKGRGRHVNYLFFGYRSGLVFEYGKKYFTTRFGRITSDNHPNKWVVQYDDLDHEVTYTCTYDSVDLYIIDHKSNVKFDTDYNRVSIESALKDLY